MWSKIQKTGSAFIHIPKELACLAHLICSVLPKEADEPAFLYIHLLSQMSKTNQQVYLTVIPQACVGYEMVDSQ